MPRLPRRVLLVALALVTATPAFAQLPSFDGIPAHSPINPTAARRTGLFIAPYLAPSAGWRVSVGMDWGSAIEASPLRQDGSRYLLDAEVTRVQVDVARDLGARHFVALSVNAAGVGDGKLDRALDWVHERVGFHMEGRATRPLNVFSDSLVLADGTTVVRNASGPHLGDVRMSLGRRHDAHHQTMLSVTAPTSRSLSYSGRGVPTVNVVHTLHGPLTERVLLEGTAGLGYSPSHGPLAAFQREVLGSGSAGVRVKVGRAHALYYFMFVHSPYHRGTGIPELDGGELSQELGWIVGRPGARQLRFALTEDVIADDQALDVVFKISASW